MIIRLIARLYGLFIRLYPAEFRDTCGEELQSVFEATLKGAMQDGFWGVAKVCLRELRDLPINLVVEHLSTLQRRSTMKSMSFEIGRSRAVLMAALSMMVGWVLINLVGNYSSLKLGLHDYPFSLVGTIVFTLPVILCGLMLGIAAGLGRRALLRIGLWTTAGGILGHLVALLVRMANSVILFKLAASPKEYETFMLFGLVLVMSVYGLFNGAGLGLAFGGRKACLKFALIGLVANAVGIVAGYFISRGVSRLEILSLGNNISYITWSVMGVLAGGTMGWFFGKKRQSGTDPVVRADNA